MSRRRVLAVVASSVLLSGLAVGASPVASASPAPTAQQLADAARRVQEAKDGLDDVQVRAEAAAEAYNGAQVQAASAQAASAVAAAAAASAEATAAQARAAADAAQAVADAASEQADEARAAHERAVAAEQAAQAALNAFAAGAYRSGGNLALISALLDADPLTYETGREMINRVDAHQQDTVVTLATSKRAAADAQRQAVDAQQSAFAQAQQVTVTATAAAAASAAATSSAAAAGRAASAALAAAAQADAARQHALALVAAAEAALGSASADAASLQAKAAAARRDAATTRATGATAPAGSAAAIAINAAYGVIGTPYSWGGGNASGPTRGFAQGAGTIGFDCSGLTLYAYAHAGIRLPHYTQAQYQLGRHVSRGELVPGDLMFFATDTSDPGTIHHVSIYLGGGKMIEAPHTGDVVKVASANRSDFIGGVRLAG